MRQWPPRRRSRIAAKTLGGSKRSGQYQSIVPSVPTRATVCRSPMTPCSAIGRYSSDAENERSTAREIVRSFIRVTTPPLARAGRGYRRRPAAGNDPTGSGLLLRLLLGRRLGRLGRGRSREVAAAGGNDDVPVPHEVARGHGALLHADEGAVAVVLGEPRRPAHGRRGVPALRAELAGAAAPEVAHRLHGLRGRPAERLPLRLRPGLRLRERGRARLAEVAEGERELGDPRRHALHAPARAARAGLADRRGALVELGE